MYQESVTHHKASHLPLYKKKKACNEQESLFCTSASIALLLEQCSICLNLVWPSESQGSKVRYPLSSWLQWARTHIELRVQIAFVRKHFRMCHYHWLQPFRCKIHPDSGWVSCALQWTRSSALSSIISLPADEHQWTLLETPAMNFLLEVPALSTCSSSSSFIIHLFISLFYLNIYFFVKMCIFSY